MEYLTKSAYARHRGVSPAAITNFIARGRLTAPALTRDGKIDPALADQQLGGSLDPVKSASARSRVPRSRLATAPAVPTADQVSSSQLLRARAISASVEAERARRELNAERGKYVMADAVKAEWAKALGEFLQGIDLGLADLASDAGLTRPQMIAVCLWWRRLRERSALSLGQPALAEPEYEVPPTAPR